MRISSSCDILKERSQHWTVALPGKGEAGSGTIVGYPNRWTVKIVKELPMDDLEISGI